MTAYDTLEENDLVDRLGHLGETTTFDPDALAKILERGQEPASHNGRRVLLAVAAGSLVVGGVAAVSYDRGGEKVGTKGGQTPADDPRPTPTTVEDASSDPSTTTAAPTTVATPETTSSTVPDDGMPAFEPDEPQDLPERMAATLTIPTDDYTVELVWKVPMLYIRTTTGLGNSIDMGPGPDGHGAFHGSSWANSGPRCVQSGEAVMAIPGVPTHSFTYGFIGADIARIELVMQDGTRVPVQQVSGAVVHDGLRAWIVDRPNGHVTRVEGFDGSGNVVAEVTDTSGSPPSFGYSVDTCS